MASFGDTINQSTKVFSMKIIFSTNLQKIFSLKSFPLLSGCILCVLMYQLKLTQILLVPQVAQLINYAKNLHEEEKHIVRTLRLQQDAIW